MKLRWLREVRVRGKRSERKSDLNSLWQSVRLTRMKIMVKSDGDGDDDSDEDSEDDGGNDEGKATSTLCGNP